MGPTVVCKTHARSVVLVVVVVVASPPRAEELAAVQELGQD